MDVKAELESLADSEYRDFTSALIPNVEKSRVIGVRLPQIKKLADRVAKNGWREFLSQEPGDTL